MGSQAERADPGLLAIRPAPDDDLSSEPRIERPAEESVVRPNLETSRQVFLVDIRPRHGRGSGPRSSGVENHVTAGRSYRTNIDILNDLLKAARTPVPKTRFMWAAGLNRHSFEEYLHFCTENDLIRLTSGGYVATRRGDSMLEAIEAVRAKTTEFESDVHRFLRNGSNHPVPDGTTGAVRHYISQWAWNEIVLNGGSGSPARRSGGFARKGPRAVSDREVLRAGTLSPDGRPEERARLSETRIPTGDPPAGKRSRRNGASSRPGR